MFRRVALSLVLVVAGFVGGLVVTGRMRTATESAAAPNASVAPAEAQRAPGTTAPGTLAPVAAGTTDFTRVAAQAVKGVANISSLQVVRQPNSPFSSDPFFRYFFGDDDSFGSRDRRSMSLGSGVIISPDGYIVTNNHVIGENGGRVTRTEITITLPDKREIRGRIIGADPATDIALVKANLTGLAVVPWGDSTQLKIGEWVLAVGSPFSLSQTVTAGIISAVGRSNLGFADYEDFIQTDAAINPGNSGGALINTRGELIGINTGIYSQSGGYMGIGFAVPSNLARHVVDDLMKYGEVRRGSIGSISIEKLTPEWAGELGAPNTKGALVSRMTRASEAYEAGLRPGDIIVGFNGQAIDDPSQFSRMVADAKVGTTATVKILRNGRAMEFKLPIVSSSTRR
ncbi:MAG TPA: trypsin-like peptidase domain-containing protein [Vicinamibacterales bacterium]|nr:trypsin-like peptidase domain-containing protein [Vicinamibacterales bacterium]